MPFKKGTSGNTKGRPAGVRPRKPAGLNLKINKFLDQNFNSFFKDLETPESRERARIYCELLKYSVPKMAPKRTDVKFENLSDAQLDEIIDVLQANAMKGLGVPPTHPANAQGYGG